MTEAEHTQIEARPLLLYDGVCALCNHLVRFLLKRDHRATLRFAPLESPLGREILARFGLLAPPGGIVLITGTLTPSERLHHRSSAIAEALQLLDNPWKTMGQTLSRLPLPLREPAYRLIARLRYRLFGRFPTCPIPTPEERSRILGVCE
ncbi:MAG: DCC1-like thiol-disulfide oxidoreductase family protein [Edaphobacter sp.]